MLAEYLLQVRLKARDSGLYPALAKLPDLEVNDVCVDAGVGYLLVAVGVGDNFGDICQFYHIEGFRLALIFVFLVDLVEDGLGVGDVGKAGLVLVLFPESLENQFLKVVGVVGDESKDGTKQFLLVVEGKSFLGFALGLQPLEKLAADSPVVLVLDHACLLRVHPLEQVLFLGSSQLHPHLFYQRQVLAVGDHSDVLGIHLPEVLFQLYLDCLEVGTRLLHYFDEPPLVGQQVGVDPDVLLLFHLDLFPQDLVLPGVPHPAALVGSSEVENSLPDQQLLGKGVVDPFLGGAGRT